MINEKEESEQELSKISVKMKNAAEIVPALKKSEEQTWNMIKELRDNLSCLNGNCILAAACLVYLPLKRLKLKKEVLDSIKKILNGKFIEFSIDFMGMISENQDAVLEDLNAYALRNI